MSNFATIKTLFFPDNCAICYSKISKNSHADNQTETMLCQACRLILPWNTSGCKLCGRPLPDSASAPTNNTCICGTCLINPPAYHRLVSLFYYKYPVPYLIHALKFNSNIELARCFGLQLAEKIRTAESPLPDMIVPVPLHPARQCRRGYNQALEIARPVASKLHIPIAKNICKRVRNTRQQSNLNAPDRKNNLENAFQWLNTRAYNHIAIIDDVITTGSTVNALIHSMLKNIKSNPDTATASNLKIEVWCIARSILN